MSLDPGPVGEVAAELMDVIQENYDADECEIGMVGIVVEVTNNEEDWTEIRYRCSDGRHWMQAGLFEGAIRAVLSKD